MRILLVAMPNSIHTARWLSQVTGEGWQTALFPSTGFFPLHPEIQGVTYFGPLVMSDGPGNPGVKPYGIPTGLPALNFLWNRLNERFWQQYRTRYLLWAIRTYRPDIVHSLEFQAAGYLTLDAKLMQGKNFPTWITTPWGSDMFFFSQFADHAPRISRVLANCDYCWCESRRDQDLAKGFGLRGELLPVSPATGGLDMLSIKAFPWIPVSQRKLVMLKGYQGWAGRALVGLRAIERAQDILKSYQIVLYSAQSDVCQAANLFSRRTGLPVTILPPQTPHLEVLRFHSQARISMGLSISDGVPSSMLEAMAVGSFPIQSETSCGNEWLVHGETGFLVPPEDPDVIEQFVRRAISDDELVNHAARKNLQTIEEKMDRPKVRREIRTTYAQVFRQDRTNPCLKKRFT
jgi:hypothetical protein